jgi:hypothetical protein
MMHPVSHALVALLLASMAGCSLAQAAGHASPPNISGVWSSYGSNGKIDDVPRPKFPPPQFKGEYLKRLQEMTAVRKTLIEEDRIPDTDMGRLIARTENECGAYGMPSVMWGPYSLEFIQQPHQITIISESQLEVRRIYMNTPQLPIEEVPPSYAGRSVGRWEGDTLVVDTVGVKTDVIFSYDNGLHDLPHSSQMRITEKIRRMSPTTMQDVITIDDPLALEKPYQFAYAWDRLKNYETPEYYCDNKRQRVGISDTSPHKPSVQK